MCKFYQEKEEHTSGGTGTVSNSWALFMPPCEKAMKLI
jgi:hypothetical protein